MSLFRKQGAAAAPPDGHRVAHFDEVAGRYVEELDRALKLTGADSSHFYRSKISLIKRVATEEPRVILDFGCGVGVLSRMLADAFPAARVIGVDASSASIVVARTMQSSGGRPVEYFTRLADIGVAPDLVTASGVFHHILPGERAGLLKEIIGLMAAGGSLIIFEHNPISPLARLIVAMAKMDEGARLIYPWKMLRLLKDAGAASTRLHYISFFPPSLKPLLRLEAYLKRIPLSAQYMAIGQKV
jgi:2-polyprenyl-3-methyl-5-hydroxy-6-metoxy-1,4-benzoquinol methylase